MRWTVLLLVITLTQICSKGYSQITLKKSNAPLETVLADIEKQTKYVFLYDGVELNKISITVNVRNATLQETLEKCFGDLPVEFSVVGHNILLKKNLTDKVTKSVPERITMTGRVVDENGQPLTSATVFNKVEKNGTETDSSGAFSITGIKGDVLQFSYVGFKAKEISISDQRYIQISLELHKSSPEQVVVIGYGSAIKKDLTGSVSIIDMKNVDEIPFNTVDNVLAGKAAGVQVTKTDGTPGGMARVRIRGTSSLLGSNDPLYVIDGVPVQVRNNYIYPGFTLGSPGGNMALTRGGTGAALSASFVNGTNSLSGLNPADIESITVLKDASSTAIYGSKASNGVVMITTKTGRTNMQPRVAVDYYFTVSSPYKPPKLLNASQYKTLMTEAAQNAFDVDTTRGITPFRLTTFILDSPSAFSNSNTDWIKEVTRTTISNNVGISVSGGGPASKYFSSIFYNNTPGVVDGSSFQRISGKFNLESRIASRLSFTTNLLVGFTNQDLSDGAYMQAILARPDLTPRDITGNFTDFSVQGGGSNGFYNPASLLTATNNCTAMTLLGSVSGIYDISKNFRFRSAVSVDMQNYNQRNYLPSYIKIPAALGYVTSTDGIGSNANSRFVDWFIENTLTFTKQFKKHAFNVVIGQSYETTKYNYYRVTGTGYPNNTTLTGLSSARTLVSAAGDDPTAPQSYLLSFYARANYSYMDKYLFTFAGRADGSSKLGSDNKYGFFPSGAVAWRISRENFLKGAGWLSDLKLRGSYGLTGNQNIGDQMYRTLYNPVTYAGSSALIPVQLGNEGIKWESTTAADIGLDVSLLNARLNATFDYYNRQTDNALFSLPLAASSSYPSLLENTIGLRNRGFEVSVGGDIIQNRNFKWTASINITWNNTLVTRLPPQADLSQIKSPAGLESIADSTNYYNGNTLLAQNKPLGLIATQQVTGLIRTQAQLDAYNAQLGFFANYFPAQIGDPMYKMDTTTASYGYEAPLLAAFTTNGAPKYYGGMTQEFSYKRFDLNCYFTFSYGGHLLWAEHVATVEFSAFANANHSMLNRYTPANTNSEIPLLSTDDQYSVSNLDVFSSSYFKLRSLTLNYRFDPSGWTKKVGITNAKIFISATNVFTITKYPGSDPEISDDPYSVTGGYIDAGNYPAIKTFSLGFKAEF